MGENGGVKSDLENQIDGQLHLGGVFNFNPTSKVDNIMNVVLEILR